MDEGALIAEMTKKGHTPDTARAAIAGRGIADLWREYMGGSSGGGGEGKTPQQIAEEYTKALLKAQQKQIDEETKFLEGYTKENPFVFDEELARRSSAAEYQPYYSELLQDYLNQMDIKRETLQSDVDLLKEMKRYDMQSRSRAYQMAVAGAEEGYAGQGMFFSGLRRRGVGQRTVAYKAGVGEAEARYGEQFGDYGRQKELYDLQERQKRLSLFGGDVSLGGVEGYEGRGGEYQAQLEGGVLQREKEAKAQYYVPLEQAYYRKFPTGTGGTLKGYTVPEYYRV